MLPQILAFPKSGGSPAAHGPREAENPLLCRKAVFVPSRRGECSRAVPSDSGPTNQRYLPDMVMSAALPITRQLLSAPSAPRARHCPEGLRALSPFSPSAGRQPHIVCPGSVRPRLARPGLSPSPPRCRLCRPVPRSPDRGAAARAAERPDTYLPFPMGTRSLHISG